MAYYGPSAAPANAQVTRSVNTSLSTAPVVTFNVVPGVGASCLAVTESLPPGLAVMNISAGGNYIASNNVVVWGPFFGTNAQVLSYTVAGQPGVYPVQASWSVDGVGGGEPTGTNLLVAVLAGSAVPSPPPQVAVPVFAPASGASVPASVTITCATPGATIYYTTNGSLPTSSSTPYSGTIPLTTAGVVRAVGVTNGCPEWHKCPGVVAVVQFVPGPSKVRQARLKMIPAPKIYFSSAAKDLTLRSS